jgi:hypothetical protein
MRTYSVRRMCAQQEDVPCHEEMEQDQPARGRVRDEGLAGDPVEAGWEETWPGPDRAVCASARHAAPGSRTAPGHRASTLHAPAAARRW